MPILQRREASDTGRVIMVHPNLISPNPDQPRQQFDPQGLFELADSIRVHGILQPLTVRRRPGGRFELVAGERRLRAAIICGLSEVPCLALEISRESSALLSLIENLQRRDLDFFEEAQALDRLITSYGLSQEELAKKLGKSQSSVANKLRLLRLPDEVLELLRQRGYTERHARALLRLPDGESQLAVATLIVEEGFNVARTEQHIAEILHEARLPPRQPAQAKQNETQHSGRRSYLIRDVRFFLNTINNGLSLMQSAGVQAEYEQVEEEGTLLISIRIPKELGAE